MEDTREDDREADQHRGSQWGEDIDDASVDQMRRACELPIAVRGALMPDAHLGYGLPIGGVLATRNAVIPYAVGVDIACRMKLSVWDMPPDALEDATEPLVKAIESETRFGIGADFERRRQHPVMDEDWRHHRHHPSLQGQGMVATRHQRKRQPLRRNRRPRTRRTGELGLDAGRYLALLSHSGSRGVGNLVARHFADLAMTLRPDLPKQLRHLAWLDLDTEAGHDYWQAMELMGRYAAANHELIHHHIAASLGVEVIAGVENHHNFAWLEEHDGEQLVVHRKGATPAGEGVLGIIPGSMATSAFVVRGTGNEASLRSASHGAGRRMSRKQAKKTIQLVRCQNAAPGQADPTSLRRARRGAHGLQGHPRGHGGSDRIWSVPVAQFQPRLVKMAPSGEPPED